jgi:hypothetical protein
VQTGLAIYWCRLAWLYTGADWPGYILVQTGLAIYMVRKACQYRFQQVYNGFLFGGDTSISSYHYFNMEDNKECTITYTSIIKNILSLLLVLYIDTHVIIYVICFKFDTGLL